MSPFLFWLPCSFPFFEDLEDFLCEMMIDFQESQGKWTEPHCGKIALPMSGAGHPDLRVLCRRSLQGLADRSGRVNTVNAQKATDTHLASSSIIELVSLNDPSIFCRISDCQVQLLNPQTWRVHTSSEKKSLPRWFLLIGSAYTIKIHP